MNKPKPINIVRKPINIVPENDAWINDILLIANGKAATHTWNSYLDVIYAADEAEARLEKLGIPKVARKGATYIAQSGETLPNSYGHRARTTTVTITRKSKGWVLVSVAQSELYPRQRPRCQLVLTPEQDAAAVAVVRRAYSVQVGA